MATRMTVWPEGQEPTRYESLDTFLGRSVTVQGNIEIMHGNRPIHVNWREKPSETTLVVFGGAVSASVKTVPAYSGRSTTGSLDANVLMVSDPTLKANDDLTLAWYAGSVHHKSLQADIASIILSLAMDSRIILFGGSGGGFAALEQGTRLPGSTVLAINPQTDISRYDPKAVLNYLRTAWYAKTVDSLPLNHSVVDDYSYPVDTRVVYIQNIQDRFHVRNHQRPFARMLHSSNRVHLLSPNLGEGHVGPDKKSYVEIFRALVEESDWTELVARLNRTPIVQE